MDLLYIGSDENAIYFLELPGSLPGSLHSIPMAHTRIHSSDTIGKRAIYLWLRSLAIE